MKTGKLTVPWKPGDPCPMDGCEGKMLITLTCSDSDCGTTVHPEEDDIQIPGLLTKTQANLLLGFLNDHRKDIERGPHALLLNRIMNVLRDVK